MRAIHVTARRLVEKERQGWKARELPERRRFGTRTVETLCRALGLGV